MNVHHPQTAAEALAQMEKVQQRDKNLYRFPFTPERSFSTNSHHKRSTLLPQYHQPSYVVKFPQDAYRR